MNIITRFIYKIKHYLTFNIEEVGIICIVVLVSTSSYYLGKNSVYTGQENNNPVYIENSHVEQSNRSIQKTESNTNQEQKGVTRNEGQVVASKNGKKYYFPWCSSAGRISPKNRIYFASAEEAVKAGLTPASNCKSM